MWILPLLLYYIIRTFPKSLVFLQNDKYENNNSGLIFKMLKKCVNVDTANILVKRDKHFPQINSFFTNDPKPRFFKKPRFNLCTV